MVEIDADAGQFEKSFLVISCNRPEYDL